MTPTSGRAPRIDAHMHWWKLARGDYGWLTVEGLTSLYRDFLPPDCEPLLDAAGIDGVVLVQAAQSDAETRFLLELAEGFPKACGVVGWTDLTAPRAPDRIAALAANPWLRAIRPMLQDLPEDDWMLRRELDPAFRAIREVGLKFDALVKPRHLIPLARLIERQPELAVIVDHCAKPEIAHGRLEAWRRDLAPIAAIPNVHCKLSGLVTEARAGVSREDLRPYVDTVLELFGPERLIFGSDWPMCTLRCDYLTWWAWAHELTVATGPAGTVAIFGGNAVKFYGLALATAPHPSGDNSRFASSPGADVHCAGTG